MRSPKFAPPASLLLLSLLVISCGGGGGSISPPNPTPTPTPSQADFQVSVSPATSLIGVGKSGTVQVAVGAVGSGTTDFQVTLSTSAPQGITATLSQPSLSSGQTSGLAVSVGPSVIALTPAIKITITGKRGSDSVVRTVDLPIAITIGGGTLSANLRTQGSLAVPSSAVPYITSLLTNLTASGLLYDTCGSASGTRSIDVVFDPPNNEFVSNASGGSPTVHVANLPTPDANGVDQLFDQIFTHEFIHALRNDPLALQEISSAHDIIFAPDEEGFATGCARLMMRRFVESGKRKEAPNFGYESSTLIDTLARLDPVVVMGIRGQSPYNFAMYNLGEASYRLLIGPQGVASYAAYEDKYFSALNANGSLLSKAQRQTFLNSIAVIDGMPAGDWFSAHASIFLQSPTPSTGIKFIALPTPTPYYPNAIMAQAFMVDVDGGGAFRYTPVTNGPVTIDVLDANGTAVLPQFTTDLANTSLVPAPFPLGLQNKLLPGGYTLVVKATANGQQFTQKLAVAVVPTSFQGSLSTDQVGPSYIYAVSVDAQGSASTGALAVTEGTVVYRTTGLVIIQAGSNGEVTVNGNKFTAPGAGSRAVFVLAQ